MSEEKLYHSHPVMFRNNPPKFLGALLLSLIGVMVMIINPLSSYTGIANHLPDLAVGLDLAVTIDLAIGFVLLVLGPIILAPWWLRCKGTCITVTDSRLVLRQGIFAKHTTEIYHDDVRHVELRQSFFNRIMGVGTISIASAGTGGVELRVEGIRNPTRVKEIIDRHRNEET